MFDINNIPLDDEKTWDLICSGNIKGCFQIESNLGKKWCKIIKPRSIQELSDVISLIRPGALKSFLDNKNMTQHYADRKNNLEEITSYHPIIDEILKDTFNVITYQEQIIFIAQRVAGFSLKESDLLRKIVGKKLPKEMTQMHIKFVDGCKKEKIVTEQQAEELFNWIEKSQRYLFNKSHGIAYAIESYWCAYLKANYTLNFFTSWLKFAKNKQDKYNELRSLIEDAKFFNIDIRGPSLLKMNVDFIKENTTIWYGLSNIKGIGASAIEKLKSLKFNSETDTWMDYLIFYSNYLSSTINNALICSGALDFFGLTRNAMIIQYNKWNLLTEKEQDWCRSYYWSTQNSSLIDILEALSIPKKNGGGTSNKNRSQIVKSIIKSLQSTNLSEKDDPEWIINQEHNLLGIPMTYHRIDQHNTSLATHTCKQLLDGCQTKYCVLGVEIQNINEYVIKSGRNKGQKMAFLKISDDTGSLDNIVVFTNILEEYSLELKNQNVVLMKLNMSNKGGWILQQVWQI